MSKKQKKNYLDYVPVCAPEHSWDLNERNLVVIRVENSWDLNERNLVGIRVENKGFYNRLAQRFFHRPKVSHISLDEYGSFVWQQMDGKRTIFEISHLVRERYGDKAEPLIPRLAKYFRILYQNHFIGYSTPLEGGGSIKETKS